MLGELALSERGIADQGIVIPGQETVDFNFTKSVAGGIIFPASSSISAVFVQTASGLTFKFQEGSVTLDANFAQTVASNLTASGSLDLIGTSSKASIGVGILAGSATIDGNFTQTSDGILVASGASDQSANFTETVAGSILITGDAELTALFEQTTSAAATLSGGIGYYWRIRRIRVRRATLG